MARARNIKPGFFKNEDLGTSDPFVSLLFAGLWTLADKAGILEDRPLRIKAELFPYRESFDINGYLTVLVSFKLIHRYEAGGVKLIQITNFEKHQNPHHTEKDSEFIPYSDTCKITVKAPLNNGDTPADSLIPDSLNTDSLIPERKAASAAPRLPAKVEIEFQLPEFINREHWELWLKTRKGKKLTFAQKNGYVQRLWNWMQKGLDYSKALEDAALAGWQGLHEPAPARQSRDDLNRSIADQLTGRGSHVAALVD